jgi:hypothetical protein
MFSQGYVGVSKNTDRRWKDHQSTNSNSAYLKNAIKKYGWDNLVKSIVLIADEQYCFAVEKNLRSGDKIGWNLVAGGGNPPSQKGKIRSLKTRLKKSGKNHPYFKKGKLLEGTKNPNFKGKIIATCLRTNKKLMLNGAREITLAGFTTSNVYACIRGKQTKHKGYTFTRETKWQL